MRFLRTSAALTFLMDPARRFVAFNQSAYPALQCFSVLNRATEKAVIQTTSSNQPTWSGTQLAGQYINVSSAAVGASGLGFSGAQYLEHDDLASVYAGAEVPVTVVCGFATLATGGTLWSFGDASDAYYLSLKTTSAAGGTLTLTEVNANGTYTASATGIGTGAHVATATRANGSITLRLDSAQVATTSVVAGTQNFSTFVLGALNSNGTVGTYYNGSLGKVAVFSGAADIFQVETEMLQGLGVIRGASSGINSGF